ncbi:unnamed protein product [Fraxinus pennsylvanica]|uniref:Uncharacterized protein n=1 Tax=Fraxinus pennsylvanica TaxID=56036 RepID=A0AAD2AEJ5_9LAMI|nr:unnamed protein product [Fraxinus pennsylvanica]
MFSPKSFIGTHRCSAIGMVPMLLLDIIDKKDKYSGCLTPQKMFLNSIDTVEKVVMEELPKLKRTPSMLLLDITDKKDKYSGCLTPQKMFLNSIDTVEKVVMEELPKLKRTPSVRMAKREKRVRTLMLML